MCANQHNVLGYMIRPSLIVQPLANRSAGGYKIYDALLKCSTRVKVEEVELDKET